MLIADCRDQLKEKLDIFDHIYNGSSEIANNLIEMDKENIKYEEIKNIFLITSYMHEKMPAAQVTDIWVSEYFKGIDYSFIDNIRNEYQVALELLNTLPGMPPRAIDRIESYIRKIDAFLEDIKNKSDFKKVRLLFWLFDNLELYTRNEYKDIYNIIFKACLDYRNEMVKYANSLELPVKPDWE
jgi:hypothetical protein